MSINRKDMKTFGPWTLQRREYNGGNYDYIIQSYGKRAVHLYVNDRPDFKADRMVYTVEFSPSSSLMDLEEAADFVTEAQQALTAANVFQQAIDSAESN